MYNYNTQYPGLEKYASQFIKKHRNALVGAGLGSLLAGTAGALATESDPDESFGEGALRRLRNGVIAGAMGGIGGGAIMHALKNNSTINKYLDKAQAKATGFAKKHISADNPIVKALQGDSKNEFTAVTSDGKVLSKKPSPAAPTPAAKPVAKKPKHTAIPTNIEQHIKNVTGVDFDEAGDSGADDSVQYETSYNPFNLSRLGVTAAGAGVGALGGAGTSHLSNKYHLRKADNLANDHKRREATATNEVLGDIKKREQNHIAKATGARQSRGKYSALGSLIGGLTTYGASFIPALAPTVQVDN